MQRAGACWWWRLSNDVRSRSTGLVWALDFHENLRITGFVLVSLHHFLPLPWQTSSRQTSRIHWIHLSTLFPCHSPHHCHHLLFGLFFGHDKFFRKGLFNLHEAFIGCSWYNVSSRWPFLLLWRANVCYCTCVFTLKSLWKACTLNKTWMWNHGHFTPSVNTAFFDAVRAVVTVSQC